MLHHLFTQRPYSNPTLVPHFVNKLQLMHVNCGTLSSADLKVLSIFQLIKITRKLSVSQLFERWSAVGSGEASGKVFDAVQSLGARVVLTMCLSFSTWHCVFLILLFRALMQGGFEDVFGFP